MKHSALVSSGGCNKIPQTLVGLNNRSLFLTVLEAGESKNNVAADLVSDESSLPGL